MGSNYFSSLSSVIFSCYIYEHFFYSVLDTFSDFFCLIFIQRIPKRNPSIPFGSYYLPKDGPTDSTTFPLINLLSNYTDNQESYTFFFLDIPAGAAGSIIRIQIRSIGQDNFELYSKFGGLPSNDTWDYYATSKNNSGNPVLLSSNGTTGAGTGGISEMYMLYAREGTWCIALRHPSVKVIKSRPLMSVSLVGCYKGCNGNGTCKYSVDESGLTFYRLDPPYFIFIV